MHSTSTSTSPRRRAFAALALAVPVALAAVAQPAIRADPATAASAKPNVVVVLTDDMILNDLYETRRANGKGRKLMPLTRGLIGGRGVSFTRYYASDPISCPSRTTNLTGQYSHNHGNTRNTFGKGKYCSDEGRVDHTRVLPAWLQTAGYRTLHYGRFLNAFGIGDPTRVPEGWDTYVQPVDSSGSEAAAFFGYRLNRNGVVSEPYGDVDKPDKRNYFTDVMVNQALADIASDTSKPFYLQLDHRAPHEDVPAPVGPQPAPRHSKILRGEKPRKTPAFNERDVSDKAPWLRRARMLNREQKKLISVRNRRRLRSLAAVDDGVGRIVKKLKALGELSNTYIVFTSDNGFFNGEHRISKGKYRPYENSSHVPFLIRGPGIPRGKKSAELTMNVDLAPTIAKIARIKPPIRVDGRSLLPFARKPTRRSRRPVFLEAYPPNEAFAASSGSAAFSAGALATTAKDPTPPNWKAIVYGRYKLVSFAKQGYEFYDLARDPYEIQSIRPGSRYRPVFRFLREPLKRLAKCRGGACRKQLGKLPRPKRR